MGRAGRRRALAPDRARARRLGDDAGHRRLRRASAPADRLDPVRRLRPATARRVLALPGRVGDRRVRRLRLRPGRGHRAEDRQAGLEELQRDRAEHRARAPGLRAPRRRPEARRLLLGARLVERPEAPDQHAGARDRHQQHPRRLHLQLEPRRRPGRASAVRPRRRPRAGLAPARRPAQPAADALQRRVAAAGRPRAGHPALRRLGRPVHAERRRRQPRAAGHHRQHRPQERPHERAVSTSTPTASSSPRRRSSSRSARRCRRAASAGCGAR